MLEDALLLVTECPDRQNIDDISLFVQAIESFFTAVARKCLTAFFLGCEPVRRVGGALEREVGFEAFKRGWQGFRGKLLASALAIPPPSTLFVVVGELLFAFGSRCFAVCHIEQERATNEKHQDESNWEYLFDWVSWCIVQ